MTGLPSTAFFFCLPALLLFLPNKLGVGGERGHETVQGADDVLNAQRGRAEVYGQRLQHGNVGKHLIHAKLQRILVQQLRRWLR